MSSEEDEVLLAVHIKTAIILVLCTAGITGHVISIYILYSMINPNNLFMISMSWHYMQIYPMYCHDCNDCAIGAKITSDPVIINQVYITDT
ncbi:Uncharacterized protein BM_BM6648 [Brugia malayi]|uniref:Uncharacterized protein n=1 Tax=Brugia malayi TaxID=6279 RepID=A0A4E9FJT8_BRUMA|nr:Uncharacterized protein BM_BM6648 [Brugia malayi]VIO93433.1 Uncharacterized protein BM_BM6648 [Brugia malayi]